MLLYPKKITKKKIHMVIPSFNIIKYDHMRFGNLGIASGCEGYITSRQIESCRRILVKSLRKSKSEKTNRKVWIRVFPFLSITKKPSAVRMGKGKGKHSFWACPVKKGQILFEINGLTLLELKKISNKISVRLSMITYFT